VYYIVIVTMILPIVGNLPSEITVAKFFGFYDHIWGLWLMKANFLGMYFLVFFEFFRGIPKEYTEAAKIDGAGNSMILSHIMLPLAKNTFFTVMLITFIGYWNDYQVPLIYLPSYPTAALGMYYMAYTTDNGLSTIPMRMTGAMLMLIPILIVFLIFQKRLIGNLAIGGIKG
jgi:multiple sugar transport system permease protein